MNICLFLCQKARDGSDQTLWWRQNNSAQAGRRPPGAVAARQRAVTEQGAKSGCRLPKACWVPPHNPLKSFSTARRARLRYDGKVVSQGYFPSLSWEWPHSSKKPSDSTIFLNLFPIIRDNGEELEPGPCRESQRTCSNHLNEPKAPKSMSDPGYLPSSQT